MKIAPLVSRSVLATAPLSATLLAAPLLLGTSAVAAPGDTLRVTADRVNLRAGLTDEANVRGQIEGGEQLLELRKDGSG